MGIHYCFMPHSRIDYASKMLYNMNKVKGHISLCLEPTKNAFNVTKYITVNIIYLDLVITP